MEYRSIPVPPPGSSEDWTTAFHHSRAKSSQDRQTGPFERNKRPQLGKCYLSSNGRTTSHLANVRILAFGRVVISLTGIRVGKSTPVAGEKHAAAKRRRLSGYPPIKCGVDSLPPQSGVGSLMNSDVVTVFSSFATSI